jgi:hypothetical protein
MDDEYRKIMGLFLWHQELNYNIMYLLLLTVIIIYIVQRVKIHTIILEAGETKKFFYTYIHSFY